MPLASPNNPTPFNLTFGGKPVELVILTPSEEISVNNVLDLTRGVERSGKYQPSQVKILIRYK